MMFKLIIIAALAVAVLAQYDRSQMKQLLRDQCKKNNAEDKVEEVENAGKNFVECIKGLVEVGTIQREIEEAKPKGELDEVFKKYCAKTPQLKTCIHNLMDGVMPCIDAKLTEQVTTAKNATDLLIDFVCYKDGDRIALFIAEGGPECFQNKMEDVKVCFNDVKKEFSSVDVAKNMTVAERCAKVRQFQNCAVTKLETCSTPTPANMFESLLKFILNNTPCKN